MEQIKLGKVRFKRLKHFYAKVSKRYFFEDYLRVYPDNLFIDATGRQFRHTDKNWLNNYLNHRKVYVFASQFVKDREVADIGCGSGYGCEILKEAGASAVHGADISRSSIRYARSRYGGIAEFSVQNVANLKEYPDDAFDVVVSSEVLEHIKEYQQEGKAVQELVRITRDKGLIIVATPNSELTGEHGFFYDEMEALLRRYFSRYRLFENALLPFGEHRALWEKRCAEGRVGVVVSENIDLSETMKISEEPHEIKQGIPAGTYPFEHLAIDTTRLHNTHSWIVVAINDKTSRT